jgi:hypothetical protein
MPSQITKMPCGTGARRLMIWMPIDTREQPAVLVRRGGNSRRLWGEEPRRPPLEMHDDPGARSPSPGVNVSAPAHCRIPEHERYSYLPVSSARTILAPSTMAHIFP